MKNPKNFFQVISYLQYPLLLIALFYVIHPYFNGFVSIWVDYNNALIFAGLGISFSTLQDTTKTQNNLSKKIWENPIKGRKMLVFMSVFCFLIIIFGMFSMYISESEILKELAFGLVIFGIGYIGLLKAAIEVFENHRKDKNP